MKFFEKTLLTVFISSFFLPTVSSSLIYHQQPSGTINTSSVQNNDSVKHLESRTTFTVGYHLLDGFFQMDDNSLTGYGVDLLSKITQYSGYSFEYVPYDNFSLSYESMVSGNIDLLLPYTPYYENPDGLSYGHASILESYYVIATSEENEDLFYEDFDTINQIKIAIPQTQYNEEGYKDQLLQLGIDPESLLLCDDYEDAVASYDSGEARAYITNISELRSNEKVLARFGNASQYFASVSEKSTLLSSLDNIISSIQKNETSFFSDNYSKWYRERNVEPFTKSEIEYLKTKESITFGFHDDEGYLSHYSDGQYEGIFVEIAKLLCEKLGVGIKMESLEDYTHPNTNIEVVSGFFYDEQYSKSFNFSLSDPMGSTKYYIIRKKGNSFDSQNCRIAVIDKFRYTNDYVKKSYPDATYVSCNSYQECLDSVVEGKTDMTIINNYITEYYLKMLQYNYLSVTLSKEYSHVYCFASTANNSVLSSIISKTQQTLSKEEISKAYMLGQEDIPSSNIFLAMFYQEPVVLFLIIFFAVVALIAVIILILIFIDLKKKNKALHDALSAKSEFLARMSHDMRTPMNGIIGLSYLMEESNDISMVKSYIPQLRDSGSFLLGLINDVLDVNKIESGKLELHSVVCDEEKVFASIINMVQPIIDEKNIDFSFVKKNIEWKYMLLDEQRVKQIFVNLLSNAIKFTPKGGKILFQMELISQSETLIRDKFIVKDNGCGMSEEFIKHAFEPFSQEERSTSDSMKGTGLGLPIVKKLVSLMGGTITLESKINEGTTFTVFLNFPLAEKPKEIKQPVVTENSDIRGKKILICEDQPLNAKIVIKLLQNQGCVIVWAQNGKEGLDVFTQSEVGFFDAILMDIRMPVMDGLEASRRFRNLSRNDAADIPIIALTANAYDTDVEKSKEAGINIHLAKPINPPELFATIHSLTSKK
ncbi:MAG: ATP-binding protein [Bacilli bacterium]